MGLNDLKVISSDPFINSPYDGFYSIYNTPIFIFLVSYYNVWIVFIDFMHSYVSFLQKDSSEIGYE